MIYNINFFLILLEILLFKNFKGKIVIHISKDHSSNSAWESNGERKREQLFLFITFLQLISIVCLRSDVVGEDTKSYLVSYHYIYNGGASSYLEWGNQLYIRFLSLFKENNTFFLSAYAIPTIALYYRFIRKHSQDVYMSVFIFAGMMFYFALFNIMRQSLAMAIVLQAYAPLIKKKWIRFLLIIAVAASFHSSAWIFLIVAIFPYLRFRINMGYFATIVLLCVVPTFYGKNLLSALFSFVDSRYQHYLSFLNYGERGNILNPFLYLVILFVVVLFWKNKLQIEDYILIHMMALTTILFSWSISMMIVNRLPYYFSPAEMLLLPMVVNRMSDRRTARIVQFCIYAVVGIYEVLLVYRGAHGIVPYYFFWENI